MQPATSQAREVALMKRILMVLTLALVMSAFALPEAFGAPPEGGWTCHSNATTTTRGPGTTTTVGAAQLFDGSYAEYQKFVHKYPDAQCTQSTTATVPVPTGG